MYVLEATSINEKETQETYAHASRVNDDIQQTLSALIDNFSLSSVPIGDREDIYWTH